MEKKPETEKEKLERIKAEIRKFIESLPTKKSVL